MQTGTDMTKTHHSKNRDEILACFRENPEQRYGAQEIHALLKQKGSDINLATVYRNLDRLEEERQIHKVRMIGEEENMYQLMKPACSSHLHLYCRRCGRIIHLNPEEMKAVETILHDAYGFSLDCSGSMITGLCRQCAEEEKK
jgi:Fur family ferric uptake transcriptional regulator